MINEERRIFGALPILTPLHTWAVDGAGGWGSKECVENNVISSYHLLLFPFILF